MESQESQSKLVEILKFDTWSQEEQRAFLERTGQVVFESAITRLISSLSQAEAAELEQKINSWSEEDDLFAYLIETYSEFKTMLEEESEALRTEAEEVLG
jgi:hypothetical protein